MATCRHCHEFMFPTDNYVRTGTRHYAHWNCAFSRRDTDRKKLDFLREIGHSQIINIPWKVYDNFKIGEIIEAWRDVYPEISNGLPR